MIKNNESSSSEPISNIKSNQNSNNSQEISHAFCICSRCHKICLITPDFWIPPTKNTQKKPTQQNSLMNYQVFLKKNQKWQYEDNLSAFKQNSFLNSHFLFPCCPTCFNLLINQIQLNNDFYSIQQNFLNTTESKSSTIKSTYLSKAENKIKTLQQESASLNEIVEANKKSLRSHKIKDSISPSNSYTRKNSLNISEIKQNNKSNSPYPVSTFIVDDISSDDSQDEDNENNSHQKNKKELQNDDRIQSQSSVTLSLRSPGFCGLALCLSFHITTHRHYGCINGNRLGTMTPYKVPTREFDQALLLLAHLIKSIALMAKVDAPNLIIAGGVFLFEELKNDSRSSGKTKAFTTDALSARADGLGKMKLKVKLFEKPKPDNENVAEERISLSSITKAEKKELSGSADSLKPRFYSSEAIQLTANDLKTSRGIQVFRKAISILMSIVHSVLASPAVASHFSFPYEIQNGGVSINGVSFDYDKSNPGTFTYAMKLLLFDLKSIQAKALEEDVERIIED